MKVYKIVSFIGKKQNVIFETKPFEIGTSGDGERDFNAFRETLKAFDKYCMELIKDGYCLVGGDAAMGKVYHNDKKRISERIEIISATK